MALFDLFRSKPAMPTKDDAPPGRSTEIETAAAHDVNGRPLKGPFPDGTEILYVGMGCFWGAERKFWELDGVWVTAVGYGAGHTLNPTYKEICSGMTGHSELVMVVYDPAKVSIHRLLAVFWESHDPTQGMRQGNDVGTQYRSGIYPTTPEQKAAAEVSRDVYQRALDAAGHRRITTEIIDAGPFYYAEDYHQQYLAKNPRGYCGLGGCGVAMPSLATA